MLNYISSQSFHTLRHWQSGRKQGDLLFHNVHMIVEIVGTDIASRNDNFIEMGAFDYINKTYANEFNVGVFTAKDDSTAGWSGNNADYSLWYTVAINGSIQHLKYTDFTDNKWEKTFSLPTGVNLNFTQYKYHISPTYCASETVTSGDWYEAKKLDAGMLSRFPEFHYTTKKVTGEPYTYVTAPVVQFDTFTYEHTEHVETKTSTLECKLTFTLKDTGKERYMDKDEWKVKPWVDHGFDDYDWYTRILQPGEV